MIRRFGGPQLTFVAACLVAAAVTGLSVATSLARADAQADMVRDLTLSGVPGVQVDIGPPNNADEAELNPNDTTMPVVRVTINAPRPAPLVGILQPSRAGAFEYTRLPPSLVIWHLAALEAAKHRIAAGTALAGLSITTNVAGEPPATSPEQVFGLIDLKVGSPAPASMGVEAIRDEVRAAMPAWAATAKVEVTEDAELERVVALSLETTPLFVAANDVRVLSNVLANRHAALAARGAKIGRTIVRITDARSGDPLYVSADDVLLGVRSYWDSPLVAGFIGAGFVMGSVADGIQESSTADAAPRL